MKWINYLKDTICQNSHKENQTSEQASSIKDTKSIINNFPTLEAAGPDGFTGKFYKTVQEEIIPNIHNLFQKIEAEGILLNSFYEPSITLTAKPDKDI